ncbi:MAG TPA: ABC transporter substrate-binding protein [Actinophytocola sp.]|uniref:ABC transporter substrate-binding protein n=1 Tax=Actinophytocola sp. TaxID=1872138 RepID=UPI002DBF5377|nr:ABC transporter substrate-binding protein [Actinophytocola sp.]HEU5470677.1 ABC transporter substrate-binding protein [Actinophytocola sp.]
MIRTLKVRLLAVTLVLTAAACTDAAAPEPEPGTFVVGVREPVSLLPARVVDVPGQLVTAALWTPLTVRDPGAQEVKPAAAVSVTSPDQVTWTVKLQPGMRFHDGSAVTARSYTGAWQAAVAERWPGAAVLTDVLAAKDMRAVDDLTIELFLARPFTQVPMVLGATALFPLPDKVLATRDWAGFGREPVGTGPYRLSGPWQDGVRLVRFDGYLGDAPGKAREIIVRVLDDQYDQVRAGTVDLATAVPGGRHEAMGTEFADRHAEWPLPELTYLSFPLADQRFRDPVVRHAFALAVDRAALEAGPLDRQVDPARSLLPPSVALPARSGVCRPCNHDPEAAKSLLRQVEGFTGPVHVYHAAGQETLARAVAEQLGGTLALDVDARPVPDGRAPDTLDGPFVGSRPLFSPSPREPMTGIAGYAPDGFAELLATADAAADPAGRDQLYRVAENQILRDLPVVPLFSRHAHTVWSERLRVSRPDPARALELAAVEVTG